MLVVRNAATPRPLIDEAVALLQSHKVPLGGVVLTGAQVSHPKHRSGAR